jgi:hypothetical protein
MQTAVLDKSQIYRGVMITKEAPSDIKTGEAAAEMLLKELADVTAAMQKTKADIDKQYTELNNHYSGVKADNETLKKTVEQHGKEYADQIVKLQTLTQAYDQIKKELDAPIIRGGKDLEDSDTRAAIECQRRAFLFKGGTEDEFVPNTDNLIVAKHYRSAVRKLMKVGIEPRQKIIRSFTEMETKAFEASSLDSAFFSPELLGIEIDCIVTCAELLDLYSSVTVGKSSFMYPRVNDYGAIGQYDCDAKCDAEFGPEGNIQYLNGKTYDWRGVFCFQRKVLAEANYDLLGFMYRAAQRAYRIARNQALMIGDGQNMPLGWMKADNCFQVRTTASAAVTHVEFRAIYSSIPVEYGGPITAVMHQNAFTHLATQTDSIGRFLFGDGIMAYSPANVSENIRISNCLFDPTHNLTVGSGGSPLISGDFFCAVGNWKMAYYAVSKRPLWIEQWEGKSSAWCVAYALGAEDGGFIGCCRAATILNVGP